MQRTGQQEPQRIAKLLARAGIASRREVERMIAEGRVAIDGAVLDTPATVLTSLHGVTVDGEPVKAAAPARLFLFHKPAGVLTAAFDPRGRATIYDRLPDDLPRLMPVGRLDLNTEGLLLLTTDGELKRELELPATGVERAYRARAYGDVSQTQLEELIDGVEVEGVRYGPIDANLERRTGANVWVEMVLTEGKNREVRRVLEHLGLQVSRLIRTRYGPFILGDLPVGGVGEVRQVDLIQFRASLKGNRAKATEEARANPVSVRIPEKRDVPQSDDRTPPVERPSRSPRAAATRSPSVARTTSSHNDAPLRRSPDTGARTPRDMAARDGQRRRAAETNAPRKDASRDRSAAQADGSRRNKPAARDEGRPQNGRNTPSKVRRVQAERPAPPEREELTTRPLRNARDTSSPPTDPKPRPKRGVGWAKAKPKARPGKPRKPRA